MYRIIEIKNYRNEKIKKLQIKELNNWVNLTTVNDKDYKKFIDRNLNPLKSSDIIKFRKYNNI